ncbi:MAG: extracellular solute-binding protein [Bacteroidia bacterium]|nr:extracellular solute-binding protein [Bacteroidia bacterium]
MRFAPLFSLYLLIALFSCTGKQQTVRMANDPDGLKGTISISGAFALYPLAVKWSEEFRKIHPNVTFDISAGGAGKGISDALGGMIDLGAVSRDLSEEEIKRGAFPISVAIDAVIPTVNSLNPNLNQILSKGIKQKDFQAIYVAEKYNNWNQLGFSFSIPLRAYTRSDAAGAAETWAKYLKSKQEDLVGIGIYADPGLLMAVKKDKSAIGFNTTAYVYNQKTKKQLAGIAIVPIDVNENGEIDPDENFYNTLDQFTKAIGEGKYPSPPARELFYISKGKPHQKIVIEFLKWVLTDGQNYLTENGYVNLPKDRLEAELEKLY